MRLDQLDPVAERILHVPALAAFDGLVFILDRIAATRGKLRRLGDFGEAQNILIKSPGLALAPGRHGDQDVVDGANGHLPPCMSLPALYPARKGCASPVER